MNLDSPFRHLDGGSLVNNQCLKTPMVAEEMRESTSTEIQKYNDRIEADLHEYY